MLFLLHEGIVGQEDNCGLFGFLLSSLINLPVILQESQV